MPIGESCRLRELRSDSAAVPLSLFLAMYCCSGVQPYLRITNEEPASRLAEALHRQHPHAVVYSDACGGSIIHPHWILTAAHCSLADCMLFMSGSYVLAGTGTTNDGSGVRHRVKEIYLHPLFSIGPLWLKQCSVHALWDLMLVELESPLPLDGVHLDVVQLDGGPRGRLGRGWRRRWLRPGLAIDYAAFGAEHRGGAMRHHMHIKKLRKVADDQCSRLLGPYFSKEHMLCAEGRTDTRDSACNGDSGSGLVSADARTRRLLGVLSWSTVDASDCIPGQLVVSSRVAAARPWIEQVTGLTFQ